MKMKFIKKISSLFLCMMLIMAMAFCTTGCSDDKKQETPSGQEGSSVEATVVGEGKTSFAFIVVDKDGNEAPFEIHTNKTKVGEITQAQLEEIAKIKMNDLNATSMEAAVEMIKGSCRAMGVTVKEG